MDKRWVISLTCVVIMGVCPSLESHWYGSVAKDTITKQRHNHAFTSSRIPRDADASDNRNINSRARGNTRSHRNSHRNRHSTVPPSIEDPYREVNFVSADTGNTTNDVNVTEPVCSTCEARDKRKQLRILMIKEELLRKLKLERPPTFNSSKPNITLLPEDIFNSTTHAHPDSTDDDDFQNIIFGEPPPMLDYITEHGDMNPANLIYFRLGEDVVASVLNRAHLSVYIRFNFESEDAFTTLDVYKLINDSNGHIVKSGSPQLTERLSLNAKGTRKWYSFGFKAIAQEWKHNPQDNLGLYIYCDDYHGNNLAVMQANHDSEEEKSRMPLLRLNMSEKDTRRTKRQSHQMDCHEGSTESRCCRYPLTVDFDEFGWDWILQPRQYPAFYCAGECPFTYYPGSAHSHVVLLQKDSSLAGGPCCTPVKMSRISMIYYTEDGSITSKNLEDMVVDRCGCN